MDMNAPADPSVANLSLSDPRCNSDSCIAFLDAGNRSQEITPWMSLFRYGHWTTWYYLAILGVFAVAYQARRWSDRKADDGSARDTSGGGGGVVLLRQKVTAGGRYLAYRRVRGRAGQMLELPSMGVLALLLLTVVVLASLVFAARPYYRQHMNYGSPPIAIRTGLMAFACTPVMIALAGKANLITLLTGIGHEKLNVIHRWFGWITLVLSLIHTIPFFYASLHDVGYTTLGEQFNVGGSSMYSGCPPLAILIALVLLSVPWIRHRLYEGFYFSHALLAVIYFGLLFWHSNNNGDSWVYLWATLALLLAQWLARVFYYTRPLNLRNTWLAGAMTTARNLPGGMTSIEVLAPREFDYRPGQHCFLRFPALSLLDNHPFTLASAPTDDHGVEKAHELLFMARTHSGFTKTLSSWCTNNSEKSLSAWVDGPYGGISRRIEFQYDTLVLVAGGSGFTACLPWIKFIVQVRDSRVTRVAFRWAVKEESHLVWAKQSVDEISLLQQEIGRNVDVHVQFFVTQSLDTDVEKITVADDVDEKNNLSNTISSVKSLSPLSSPSPSPSPSCTHMRPSMKEIISEEVHRGGKIFVIGCGPESMRVDLSNAVAQAQSSVLAGKVQEVALHLEAFGM